MQSGLLIKKSHQYVQKMFENEDFRDPDHTKYDAPYNIRVHKISHQHCSVRLVQRNNSPALRKLIR